MFLILDPTLDTAEQLIKHQHIGSNTNSDNFPCCGLCIVTFEVKFPMRYQA